LCTVILLRRPGAAWPLMVAANRDERLDRPWDPPAAHWPGLIGGRDRLGGGTWMALGRHGVLACVLNRPGTLGPEAGRRSRGELPLLAAAASSAEAGAAAITSLDAGGWRPFNMIVADRHRAFFLAGLGDGQAQAAALPDGVSMVTAHPPNDLASPRIARHLPRFRAAAPPDPATGDWTVWESLLADGGGDRAEALAVPPLAGFGTVCASLVGFPAQGPPIWRFCAGAPRPGAFLPLPIG
jgi:hypothetical protein